ncbi:hypothetical protein NA56DRAFT_323314 [Hyaloscypha hepaticicola]|uniref:Uncharacterized protein n=1 Tax=Hyaloscypha hepaticicola TaxID=2082293 RepID=A0A2J6PPG8_9HELO|nr:hypothetical protein NA56DRAFT_323314 [Hyaloscypha hepaticicola]
MLARAAETRHNRLQQSQLCDPAWIQSGGKIFVSIVTLGGVGAGSRKSPRPLDQPSAISHRGSVERMCSQLPTSGLAILRLRSRSFLPHWRNNDAQPVVWMAWVKLVHAPVVKCCRSQPAPRRTPNSSNDTSPSLSYFSAFSAFYGASKLDMRRWMSGQCEKNTSYALRKLPHVIR